MRSNLTSSIVTVAALLAVVSVAPAQEGPPAAQAGRGGGRGRGPARPPAGPTPHLPNDPYLGANAGKPDLGGNSQSVDSKMRGIWQVPYIIDMQKQGKNLDGSAIKPDDVPFTP